MKLAPVVLFTYNRPWHTCQTIEALRKNEYAPESDLIIFSDGCKDEQAKKGVDETRAYLRTVTGFKSVKIVEREKNYTLANNIIDGVTRVVNEYGRIIVLEDDLLTSPFFLKFMNEALEFYENIKEVISVHGYVYPVKENLPVNFLLSHTDSLGWGTWRDAWSLFETDGALLLSKLKTGKLEKKFNFGNSCDFIKMLERQIQGKNSSWAIRWYASAFLAGKLSLFPHRSFVFHNGSDGSGTHCDEESWLDVELSDRAIPVIPLPIEENKYARDVYERFFRSVRLSFFSKVKRRLKKIYGKTTSCRQ
ncbi:MAG: glycosyltransferase [Bacteroidales bacterium]|nr:glycosyltransferase [Bacteroidales bacterium]